MISVAIIGQGNVAHHLNKAFNKAQNVTVCNINSRKLDNIPIVDVCIIAVTDAAISKVSKAITHKNTLVVHTSGCVSIDSLKNKGKKGVFYLVQSFSKNKEVNFKEIPFCLEAENKKELELLKKLAKSIGKKIYQINSKQRKGLHIAAVFVNNFTNHLYKIGKDICKEHEIPFNILHPLIKETALKINDLPPEESQTGPAIRNDLQTIQNHLELLNKNEQKIYQILTKSIQNNEKKL